MSDEAIFELSGKGNRQNLWHWSAENPKEIHELPAEKAPHISPLHAEKVTVW